LLLLLVKLVCVCVVSPRFARVDRVMGRPAGLIGFCRIFALTGLLPNWTSLAIGFWIDPPGRSGFNNYNSKLCFYI
jgi:hypothetical protein